MQYLDWSAGERRTLRTLRYAEVPARWLTRLGGALAGLSGLTRASEVLDLFRRPLPLVDVNPLAVLGTAIPEPPAAVSKEAEGAKGRLFPTLPQGGTGRGRPSPDVGRVARADRGERAPVGDRDSQGSNLPHPTALVGVSGASLPEANGKTLPARQLLSLATSARPGSTDSRPTWTQTTVIRQPGVPSMSQSGVRQATPGLEPVSGSRSDTLAALPAFVSREAAARAPSDVNQRPLSRSPLPARVPDRTEAGAALLAWLTRQPGTSSDGHSARPVRHAGPDSVEHNVLRAGTSRAFAQGIEQGTASSDRLAALASPDLRRQPKSSWGNAGTAFRNAAEVDVLPSVLARAFVGDVQGGAFSSEQLAVLALPVLRQQLPARADRAPPTVAVMTGANQQEQDSVSPQVRQSSLDVARAPEMVSAEPEQVTLLRDALSRVSSPRQPVTESGSSTQTGQVEMPPTGTEAAESPAPASPDLTSQTVPAVQNTFNVTVHMEGGPAGDEQELAERLNRILVEQARRNGIDV